MGSAPDPEQLPSLLRTTFRRSVTLGRLYIVGGLVYVLLLTIVLGFDGRPAFESAIPILLPIFGVLSSLGAVTAFTSDRIKGVFEYLLAYGVAPRALFSTFLQAGLAVVTLTLVIATIFCVCASLIFFGSVSWYLAGFLVLYAFPMSYGSAAFASQVGMYFTTLSSPRGGMSGPLGILPLVAMGPSMLMLIAVGVVGSEYGTGSIYVVLATGLAAVTVIACVLWGMVARLLRRDRFLSPA